MKNVVINLLVLIVLLLGILVSLVSVQKKEPQELRTRAAPATVLSLEPVANNFYVSGQFNTSVKVNTGGNQIVSADIVLTYNPQILEASSVSLGSFLSTASELQKIIDNQNGKIIYSIYLPDRTQAKSGEGVLATVTFRAKTTGTTNVAFSSQSSIYALGENQNALTNTIPASYTIINDTVPPAAISDLTVTSFTMQSVTLSWTAPSDTGPQTTAQSYELRYSTSAINNSNWTQATVATGLPAPATPGTSQIFTVNNLNPGTMYYFSLKSKDAASNWSSLSNTASVTTQTKPILNFQIKFQGISFQKPDKTVRVILKQQDIVKYTFNNASVTSNASGLYSGSATDIDPGTYDVYVKGFSHLQKKFSSVTLNAGQNTQDFSATILKAGDFDTNNFINAVDIGKVIEHYFPNTPANSPMDFNLDGTVNALDIGFVIENYFQQGD